MKRNVSSFKVAVSKGYEPRLYSYDPGAVPSGEFEAILDFKTWSKRIIAINCYFTKKDTGNKFVVTAYCNYKTGRYAVTDSLVDFSNCPLNACYKIKIAKSQRNQIILLTAAAIA